ncbi:hypothetical protein LCGC14_0249360 [marine sediment metagenome]|uniref:Uncharacterized protein n=1 Tax=marine sediment metagenome TaxID=412755 RepID=A0A0F9X9T6_9ZZZZ
MSVASADLHKAVAALWESSGLEALFISTWTADEKTQFDALNDQEAGPQQAFPYCVFEQSPSETAVRMSSVNANSKREIHDIPWVFNVYARFESGDSTTAKEQVAVLVEEILKIFGGHPEVSSTPLALDNGNFLISQLITDYGVGNADDVYQWIISYMFKVDVPVAV